MANLNKPKKKKKTRLKMTFQHQINEFMNNPEKIRTVMF